MKKYLFTALAFITSVFLSLLIGYLMAGALDKFEVSGKGYVIFIQCFMIAFVLGATGYVYKKFDSKNAVGNGATGLSELSRADRKAFERVFKEYDLKLAGIEELIVANGKDGVSDFVIGIRTSAGKKADHEKLRAALYSEFFKKIVFVFINLDAVEGSETFFAGGKKFTGKEQV
jgi:hypothetical protein